MSELNKIELRILQADQQDFNRQMSFFFNKTY